MQKNELLDYLFLQTNFKIRKSNKKNMKTVKIVNFPVSKNP